MAQQTAVEWLEKKINIHLYVNEKTANIISGFFEQANQMFEKQIIAACNQTDVIGLDHEQPGDQYYNKTYGK